MKLVLLPGMHGTGELFHALLRNLRHSPQIITLPIDETYGLKEYAKDIESQLPDEPIVILAESFSGCLIPYIREISSKPIRAIIFVASFIACPHNWLISIGRNLPKHLLTNPWLLRIGLKRLFLNECHNKELVEKCLQVVKSVPVALFRSRLALIQNAKPTRKTFDVKAYYIQAGQDRVIPKQSLTIIEQSFSTTSLTINGPHFLIQAHPEKCAELINQCVTECQKQQLTVF